MKLLFLLFSYKFYHLKVLYLHNSVLTTLFNRDTFCQMNTHFKVFQNLSIQCVQSNKTGCEREPPYLSLLATSLRKVVNLIYSSIFSYDSRVYFIYTSLFTLFEFIPAFSTKMKLSYTVRN